MNFILQPIVKVKNDRMYPIKKPFYNYKLSAQIFEHVIEQDNRTYNLI